MSEATKTYVWPTIRAHDARALIDFLVTAFGFSETVAYGDDARVYHAELAWPLGGGVMIGAAREDGDYPWPIAPGSSGTYVVTDHLDELHQRAVLTGATISVAPRDTDYGSREFSALDVEGNRWSFGTYAGA